MNYIVLIVFGLSLFSTGYMVWRYLLSKSDWRLARISNDEFINTFKAQLHITDIGCSFAPEMWSDEEVDRGEALDALKFLVEELRMKEIRLGLRWDRIASVKDHVELAYYTPFLDYCIAHKVNICLNVGPIKTFRWPESHVPQYILDAASQEDVKPERISSDSYIAEKALVCVENLCKKIVESYSPEQLKYITIIQPENEVFNPMGVFKVQITYEYMVRLIKVIHEYFPDKWILINSSGRFNIRMILNLFSRLLKAQPNLKGRLLFGYDYYYKTEHRDKFFLSKLIDSIHFSAPHDVTLPQVHKRSEELGFGIEITEAQFEPWGSTRGPGEYSRDLRFILARSLKYILKPGAQSVIRLWGVEHLAKRYRNNDITDEHKEMIDLIHRINILSP